MTKAELKQAYDTAKTQTIAPLVKVLRGALNMDLTEAKAKAMASREEGASFDGAWEELSKEEKAKIQKFKG